MDSPLMPLQDPKFYAQQDRYPTAMTAAMWRVLVVVHARARWEVGAGGWVCRLRYADFGLPDRTAKRALAALEDLGLLAHRRGDHCIEIAMWPLEVPRAGTSETPVD